MILSWPLSSTTLLTLSSVGLYIGWFIVPSSSSIIPFTTDYIIKKGEDVKIRFVNRLDKNTSGLVIVAKNPFAQHVLSSEMKDDDFEKKYITL